MATRPMLVLVLALALLATFISLTDAQSQNQSLANGIYSIYTLPPFAITLYSGWTITDQDLPPTASALQSIVQTYLYDYFQASVGRTTLSQTSTLHSVELQISVRMVDSVRIWAELYGNAAFLESNSGVARPSAQEMHDFLDDWIGRAFDSDTSLGLFRQRVISQAFGNLVLENLKTLEVTLNVQTGPPPPITIAAQPADASGGKWSSTEFILLATLLFFIASATTAIYVFVKVERYKYRREDELESLNREGELQKSSTISACDSYEQFYSGAPEGQNVVPIINQTGSRRYIEPSSPDQLLYGASYLHNERRVLEQQFDTPTTTATTIHSYVSQLLTLESPLTSWFGNSSIMHTLFGEQNQEQDLPFVYRDFPRHDGTPCLIYNPKDKQASYDDVHIAPTRQTSHNDTGVPQARSPSPTQSFSIDMDDVLYLPQQLDWDDNFDAPMPTNSMHSTTSAHSISSTNSLEQFIDRLENLYQLKQKQYQQRMEMERERRERRLAKEGKVVSVARTPPTNNSVSTPPTASMTPTPSPDYSIQDTPPKFNLSHVLRTPDNLLRSSSSYETPVTSSSGEIRPKRETPLTTTSITPVALSPNHSIKVDVKSEAVGIV